MTLQLAPPHVGPAERRAAAAWAEQSRHFERVKNIMRIAIRNLDPGSPRRLTDFCRDVMEQSQTDWGTAQRAWTELSRAGEVQHAYGRGVSAGPKLSPRASQGKHGA